MKKLLGLVATASFLAAGASALAGDCCGKPAAKEEGFGCANMCPLAKSAGARRSFGQEGSVTRTAALAAQVQKNLAKV